MILDVALAGFGVVMIAPLVWLLSTSLTDPAEAFQIPPNWVPVNATFDNFSGVNDLVPFGQMALNSLTVSVIATVGSLLVSALAAYGFSRFSFRGRNGIFIMMLSALMVPAQLLIIPVFILMRTLNLVDTLVALWLPALIHVFSIFFLRQYFNSIPRDLDDAAKIDGAGHVWILFRMIVPLSAPAISAMAILVFEASWNNYFGPLIFISTPENMTLPLGLVTLQDAQGGVAPTGVFAAITLVVLPVLLVFLLFQRQFVASIATAGIRG
ncbi:carbohydrate ABC transporter permease [Haloactinopolyspora sp.]|uniref:carbohydrate ABC transporter permease n=1 Tax=Haloactinopolyspora sp. TaxID=1966353 RepID=UPI002629E0A3|nr:carbohydrate ABC transporter permease [Haloactinopolyspora sp.]